MNSIFIKMLFSLCSLFIFSCLNPVRAQDHQADDEIIGRQAISGQNHINLPVAEPLASGEFRYSIMQTFGEVNRGARNLWGIDDGSNIRFGLEYGIHDILTLGMGRSSMDKVIDLYVKTALVRQLNIGIPVSVTVVPAIGMNTSRLNFLENEYAFSDRLNFSFAVPVSGKFTEDFSLMMVPVVVHFNRVGPELKVADADVHTYYSIGIGGLYRFTQKAALSIQFIPPLTQADNMKPNIGAGLDIQSGGHLFQLYFTTSSALNSSYLIAGNNGRFFDQQFRFGFQISRGIMLR